MGSVGGSAPRRRPGKQRMRAVALAIALALIALALPPAAPAAFVACAEFSGPNCGDAAGDAFCAPGLNCVDTGDGRDCREIASPTPTFTATATQTGTPTRTPQPNGGSCGAASDCASTHCVEGICCNSLCNRPFETCNAPQAPGTCVQVAPAPPVSRRGLFAGLALLTMIGAAALWHQRRG